MRLPAKRTTQAEKGIPTKACLLEVDAGVEGGDRAVSTHLELRGQALLHERKDAAMAAHIEEMASRVPVGRIGTPDEVAATVSLLTSEKGAFINGQMIQVNGGAET